MRIALSIILISLVVGCSPSKVEQLEIQYRQSVKTGDVKKQLQIVDRLYALDPDKYENLYQQKSQLTPYINILLNSNSQENHQDLTALQIKALLDFSPLFQVANEWMRNNQQEEARQEAIAKGLKRIARIYATTKEKITDVPNHIDVSPTGIVVNNSDFAVVKVNPLLDLLEGIQHNKLNTYQLDALLSGLIRIAQENGSLFEQASVIDEHRSKYDEIAIDAIAQNRGVYQLLSDIYAQQLSLTLYWVEKQNNQLQSLVRTALGIRDLNAFWQKEYQPTATNMQRFVEKHHLNTLNSIHNYRLSIPLVTEDEKVEMLVPQEVKKLILSLLWPNEDIYDFYEQSEAQLALFKRLVG